MTASTKSDNIEILAFSSENSQNQHFQCMLHHHVNHSLSRLCTHLTVLYDSSGSSDSDCSHSIDLHHQQSNDPLPANQCMDSMESLDDWDNDKISRMNAKYDQFYKETLGSPKYFMAPMVGASELPFRMMGRKYGCDLCYTPMVSAKSIVRSFEENGNLNDRLRFHKLDRPLIIQLCANDTALIVRAVQIIES